MITAQAVFITAMNLMDEDSEDGTFAGYSDDYKKKAWPILTLLQAELVPASLDSFCDYERNECMPIR
jgi:hypothetical protein